MTNAYSFDGVLILCLLLICTCAYVRRVPRLKQFFLTEKKGIWGVFYKASVVGIRLHWLVAIACTTMGFYIMFLK